MKSFIFITSSGGSSLSELWAQKSLFAYNTWIYGNRRYLSATKKEISNLGRWKEQEAGETQGTNSLYTHVCQGTPLEHAK